MTTKQRNQYIVYHDVWNNIWNKMGTRNIYVVTAPNKDAALSAVHNHIGHIPRYTERLVARREYKKYQSNYIPEGWIKLNAHP